MDGFSLREVGRASKEDRELANSIYSIYDALYEVTGNYVPHYDTVSPKTECPYTGIYHNNPRTLRIYPHSNSAYCFSCSAYMSPLSIIMDFKELNAEDAVLWIKEAVGYTDPDPEEVWAALVDDTEQAPDTSALAEALKLACSRMSPDWKELQFEYTVSRKLGQCLSILPKVSSADDGERWLAASKQAMAKVLGVPPGT